MERGRGFFVVGTDTGVGKTTISVGLLRAFVSAGRRVAAMKPCETGGGDDAARLLHACKRPLDPQLVNPYRFPLPAAPTIAARAAGKKIELDVLVDAYHKLANDAELVLVEGAGGLLVPFDDERLIADLIARLDLPLLLVARTQLGTINHSLLSIEVARLRGLSILGIAFSRSAATTSAEEDESIAAIIEHAKVPCFGVLPWLSPIVDERLGEEIRTHLRVEALLDELTSF